MSNRRRTATIAASCALSTVLGSIHAFSVFIPQWESLYGGDRAGVSLIYSISLGALTIAVLFGYWVYQRLSPVVMFLMVGVGSAIGLALSAGASSLFSLYLAYGLIFGGANGLGYGYALQLSGQAAESNRGFAMGLVTAFYAVGATAAPFLLVFLINRGGNAMALQVSSVIVLSVSVCCALLIRRAKTKYVSEPVSAKQDLSAALKRARLLMWIGYGTAVAAGLMVIGHAYGIALWMSLDAGSATWSITIVALGNMLGGFSAGYMADKLSGLVLTRWLPFFTSLGLLILLISPEESSIVVFAGLGLIGYCYGALIAVYPVSVADTFGALIAPRIYGQVFTAWGLAGLLGPWVSGYLFDSTNSYSTALVIAILLSGVSIAVSHLRATAS